MEKPFQSLTTEELRAGVAEWVRQTQPQLPGPPLPPGVSRGMLTPELEGVLADNWISYIMGRRPETWTPVEREAVRTATRRALGEM